jgi:hypothetical protein
MHRMPGTSLCGKSTGRPVVGCIVFVFVILVSFPGFLLTLGTYSWRTACGEFWTQAQLKFLVRVLSDALTAGIISES